MTKGRMVTCVTGLTLVVAMSGWAQSARLTPVAQMRAETAANLPGNVQRGQYLVEHVAMCVECHSTRDEQGNIIPSTRFLGGPIPPAPSWATDWATRAPRNAGLPGYSDEAAERLLREGAIGREGVRLRPPMPRFRMNAQDAADVIAYMRTVQ